MAVGLLAMNSAAMADGSGALANPRKTCKAPIILGCSLSIPNFPGGTIAIDFDANGTGNGRWILFQHGAWRKCEVAYDLKAPAQSWLCHGLPADNYVLNNYGQSNTSWHKLGARY
ncbi:hypothetical protein [Streptosporangium sp. KLBMP 9127]|nr:hypothetical protein [Streptosporangium sp. KLBMP 9127]